MTTSIHGQVLIQAFETWAPKTLAYEGDRIGLQIGTLNKTVKKVMVTLDVLENVVDEAIDQGVDLIFSHHAVIYRPLKNMVTDFGQSKIVTKCIKHDIAVYVAHTNLDMVNGGMNDWLAKALQLQKIEPLIPKQSETLYKLAVYVPVTHADDVRQALGEAGAGAIGHYSHCTFNTQGSGTFKPGDHTQPFIGSQGQLETVQEIKIETIVPKHLLKTVIASMLKSHPYEEVAYDVYKLENEGEQFGLGRVGELTETMTLEDIAKHVKKVFGLDGVRVVGNLDTPIKKLAVIGGSGGDYIKETASRGVDVLITGDIDYHSAHDAILAGLNIIDAGHNIESVMKKGVGDFFQSYLKENGFDDTDIVLSKVNTNPFTTL